MWQWADMNIVAKEKLLSVADQNIQHISPLSHVKQYKERISSYGRPFWQLRAKLTLQDNFNVKQNYEYQLFHFRENYTAARDF
jgi:hypothetical protein